MSSRKTLRWVLPAVGLLFLISIALLFFSMAVDSRPAGSDGPGPVRPTPVTAVVAPERETSANAAPPSAAGDGSVFGRLLHSTTRIPHPGTITVSGPGGVVGTATADRSGTFRVDGLPTMVPLALEAGAVGLHPVRQVLPRLTKSEVFDTGDLLIDTAIRVVFRVVDSRDRPLPGATVVLRRWPVWEPETERLESEAIDFDTIPAPHDGVADAQGLVTFERVAPGDWLLDAHADGFAPALKRTTWLGSDMDASSGPIRVVLSAPISLTGRVLRDGVLVEGAVIHAEQEAWNEALRRSAPTGPDGVYRLDGLPPGTTKLFVATGPDRKLACGTLNLPGPAKFDFHLVSGGRIHGQVLADEDGAPIAGALVRLSVKTTSRDFHNHSFTTRTASDGSYSIDDLPPGQLEPASLTVEAAGFLPFPDGRAEHRPPKGSMGAGDELKVDVRLHRGGTVSGTVFDPDGAPLSGVRIRLQRAVPEEAPQRDRTPDTLSAADGSWRISPVEAGTWLVVAESMEFVQADFPEDIAKALGSGTTPEPWTVRLEDQEDARKDLALSRGADVVGTLVDEEGTPLPGRVVTCHKTQFGWTSLGTPSVTDDLGRFRVRSLPFGISFELFVYERNHLSAKSDSITLVDGTAAEEVRLVVAARGSITGTIVREDGTPLRRPRLRTVGSTRGLEFEMTLFELRWQEYIPVAPDGSFQVDDLSPGEYFIVAEDEGCALRPGPPIQVEGGERVTGVRVTLPAGREIAGRVVNSRGLPVAGAAVLIQRSSENMPTVSVYTELFAPTATTSTDNDGRFRQDNLLPGPHVVTVLNPGGRGSTETVEAGRTDLVLTMERGLSISGIVVDEVSGAPVEGVEVIARFLPDGESESVITGPGGGFALTGIPEGTATLEFSQGIDARDRTHGSRVLPNVPAGSTDLRVTLRRGLEISGSVVDEQGRPFVGSFHVFAMGEDEEGEDQFVKLSETGGETGALRLGGLPPGTYRVSVFVNSSYLNSSVENVRAGTTNLEFRLARAGALSGHVRHQTGTVCGTWTALRVVIKEEAQDWVDLAPPESGDLHTFAFKRLPLGEATLEARTASGTVVPLGSYTVTQEGIVLDCPCR